MNERVRPAKPLQAARYTSVAGHADLKFAGPWFPIA